MPSLPWLKTLTLTTLNTNYSLLALMQAIDNGAPARASKLQINWDPVANTNAKVFVGNSDVSGTNFGQELTSASTIFNLESIGLNLINLSQIYLRSDTSGAKVDVIVMVQ